MRCLIVPGLDSSGPDHWQTRWERERDDCRRVELGDWDDPVPADWIDRLERAVAAFPGSPILVAHSLGCHAVASWAGMATRCIAKVAGAILVAPPDVDREEADARLRRFAPASHRPMPFRTIVVASRNDPYATFARSREMATDWAASLEDAGEAGHINAASRLANWPRGQALLDELIDASLDRRDDRPFALASSRP